jgi:DMSO reductase family type II enzyme chaperone
MELRHTHNVERARVYRALALLFRFPSAQTVADLRERDLPELRDALVRLGEAESLLDAVDRLVTRIAEADPRDLECRYEQTFEASGGLRCPPHETAHAPNAGQEGMLRNFELADIAGFYRAFGVEVSPETERVDHIVAELEFMNLLAVKEAVAETEGNVEQAEICRGASRAFLGDHLMRWVGRFAARLEESAADRLYAAAGCILDHFVAADAARVGPKKPRGSEQNAPLARASRQQEDFNERDRDLSRRAHTDPRGFGPADDCC